MNKNVVWMIVGGLLVLVVGASIGFGLGMRFGVTQAAGINFSDSSTWPDADNDGNPDLRFGAMHAQMLPYMSQMHRGGFYGGHMGGWGWFSPFGMMGGGLGGLLTFILLCVIIYMLARRNNAPAVVASPAAPIETKKK